jgi:hypothetical protein
MVIPEWRKPIFTTSTEAMIQNSQIGELFGHCITMQSCEEDRKDQLGPRDSNKRRQAMLKTTKSNNAIIFVQKDDKAQSAYLLLALPLYPTPYMKNA